jgi:hypothetical protein
MILSQPAAQYHEEMTPRVFLQHLLDHTVTDRQQHNQLKLEVAKCIGTV